MAFEVYTPCRRGGNGKSGLGIRFSKSSITLNKKAREALGSPVNVELAYDAESSTVRIAAGGDTPLRISKIPGNKFFSRFSIVAEGKLPVVFQDGALYVQL